jgi:hypothetical protein
MRERGEFVREIDRRAAGGIAAALRFKPPIPYTPANPIAVPISTAPKTKGSRRLAGGRGGGISGISFVILYQIRLCRAFYYGRPRKRTANGLGFADVTVHNGS